jgi:hypothetical protein
MWIPRGRCRGGESQKSSYSCNSAEDSNHLNGPGEGFATDGLADDRVVGHACLSSEGLMRETLRRVGHVRGRWIEPCLERPRRAPRSTSVLRLWATGHGRTVGPDQWAGDVRLRSARRGPPPIGRSKPRSIEPWAGLASTHRSDPTRTESLGLLGLDQCH